MNKQESANNMPNIKFQINSNNKYSKCITKNFEETQSYGKKFAQTLRIGDVITLFGDLGAGKTTFVQGLTKGLGIEKRVISPTFVMVRSYIIPHPWMMETSRFYHVDLYRLRGEEDIEATGLLEIIRDPNVIIAIEWPEKMGSLLPEKRWNVRFEHLEGDERRITINRI